MDFELIQMSSCHGCHDIHELDIESLDCTIWQEINTQNWSVSFGFENCE